MPKRSKLNLNFHSDNFRQISEAHCGPAVIQMLLANVGVEVSQEAVAEAGGAKDRIELHGMRVEQLAMAVNRLAPQMRFYFKDLASIDELVRIVREYRMPVGVEWQGVFEDDEEDSTPKENPSALLPDSESEEDDFGHYSIVTQVRLRSKTLLIADPYKDYFSQARIFSFEEFEPRWWDTNEVIDEETGQPRLVMDYHMMFVVTRPNALFPIRMGMRTFRWGKINQRAS